MKEKKNEECKQS